MVDNQVRFLPHPPVSRAVRYNFLLTSDLIVTLPVSALPSSGIGTLGRKCCYCNHQGVSEGRCHCESRDSSLPNSSQWTYHSFRWKEARRGVRAGCALAASKVGQVSSGREEDGSSPTEGRDRVEMVSLVPRHVQVGRPTPPLPQSSFSALAVGALRHHPLGV
jgi:hypothetical protein